jgi:hypothetical protein
MSAPPVRVALVGIDGSGKSSVVARLHDAVGVDADGLGTLSAPLYPDIPDAALAVLSRQLHAVSVAADRLGIAELKATILYLQMSLYGAAERCLIDALRPRWLVSDRHALVDTLAYGPLYRGMLLRAQHGERWGPRQRDRLEIAIPHAFGAMLSSYGALARISGLDIDFWQIAGQIGALLEGPADVVVAELSRRYATKLPDVIVWLDVEPLEAARRMRERDKPRSEMHECVTALERLRQNYEGALRVIAHGWPRVVIHRVDPTDMTIAEIGDAVLGWLPRAGDG